MANRKVEGTIRLEGLLEGPVFSGDDEDIINTFVEQANRAGLKFHAAVDTGRFSILADTEPINVTNTGESPNVRVTKCLSDFLSNYSPEERMQLMSTLRSVEYIPGHEVQSIYFIKPDGTAGMEQRIIKADTVSPDKPVEFKSKLKLIIIFTAILGLGIGISAFFVPYKDLGKRFVSELLPFDKQNLKIDIGSYKDFFRIDSVEINESKGNIQIICSVSDSYPATEKELNTLWKSPSESLPEKLTLEALARNCVRCVFSDSKGNFAGQVSCYMQWTGSDKKSFGIVIPFDRNIRNIQFCY